MNDADPKVEFIATCIVLACVLAFYYIVDGALPH